MFLVGEGAGGHPGPYGVLSGIPGLHLPVAPPASQDNNCVTRHGQMSPGGPNHPLVRDHGTNQPEVAVTPELARPEDLASWAYPGDLCLLFPVLNCKLLESRDSCPCQTSHRAKYVTRE